MHACIERTLLSDSSAHLLRPPGPPIHYRCFMRFNRFSEVRTKSCPLGSRHATSELAAGNSCVASSSSIGQLNRDNSTKWTGPGVILASHETDVVLTGDSPGACLISWDCGNHGKVSCGSVPKARVLARGSSCNLEVLPGLRGAVIVDCASVWAFDTVRNFSFSWS